MGWIGQLLDLWFAPDVSGLEHVPGGPALVVGTHNGGNSAPDMFATMVAFWRHFGPDRPAYGLAHDQVCRAPVVGRWIQKLGAVPARQAHAAELLRRGAAVLVYPGGDLDAFKPWSERHTVKFGERAGFIKTALRARVPIVPVISVGAHETFAVLTDGRDLARRLGLKRWTRLEVLPIILCLPWESGSARSKATFQCRPKSAFACFRPSISTATLTTRRTCWPRASWSAPPCRARSTSWSAEGGFGPLARVHTTAAEATDEGATPRCATRRSALRAPLRRAARAT